MGSILGGSSTQPVAQQTVTQNTQPWSGAQGTLNTVLSQANNLYNKNPTPAYFPDSTVVGRDPLTQQSLNMQQQLAQSGAPALGAANNAVTNIANQSSAPDFDVGNNPMFQNAFQAAQRQILPQVQSQFINNGQYAGSSAMNNEMASRLGDAFASKALDFQGLYGQQQQTNNQQRLQAAALAPSTYAAQYAPSQQLGQVGLANEQLAGAQLRDRMDRYQYAQQAPWQQLQNLNNFGIGAAGQGSSSTQSSPIYSNSSSNLLGGALGGARLGSMIPGLGTGIGAGIGGLLGFLQ